MLVSPALCSWEFGERFPCEYFASQLKHRKYDLAFVGTNFDFLALVLESTGSFNREGREFLSQLFRFGARSTGTHSSVYAGRAWARLSCTLQSAVAQSVINRSTGVPSVDSLCVSESAVSVSCADSHDGAAPSACGVVAGSITLLPPIVIVVFVRFSLLPPPPFVTRLFPLLVVVLRGFPWSPPWPPLSSLW